MICEACRGEGFVRGRDPKAPALVMRPCLECNGSGVASCCDAAGSTPLTTRTPPNHCLDCGYKIDAAASFEHPGHAPSPGDVAICLHCAHIHIYADDLTLRQPNDAEIVDIAGDEEIIRMMAALGELRMHEALYIDERFDERACDHCGKPYRGPAVYCSLKCAQADA